MVSVTEVVASMAVAILYFLGSDHGKDGGYMVIVAKKGHVHNLGFNLIRDNLIG